MAGTGSPRARGGTPHTPGRDSHRWRLVLFVAVLLALGISWILFWTGLVGHTRLVAGPTETATVTATAREPALPSPAPTVTKTVTATPSPVPGATPGRAKGPIRWKPTIKITRQFLDQICQARKWDSHVVIPPVGNDQGTHIHCTHLPRAIRGFDMTKVCKLLAHALHLRGTWIDLGNENDPTRWECQRE